MVQWESCCGTARRQLASDFLPFVFFEIDLNPARCCGFTEQKMGGFHLDSKVGQLIWRKSQSWSAAAASEGRPTLCNRGTTDHPKRCQGGLGPDVLCVPPSL